MSSGGAGLGLLLFPFSPEITNLLLVDLRPMAHDRMVRKDCAKKLCHCTEGKDHLTEAKRKVNVCEK